MEFGRVPSSQLNAIDFSLPKEPLQNKMVLSGKKASKPKVYVGCAKWGRPEWVGKIYPLKTKEKDFLAHYVQHYNCIELNATHYKIYDAASIAKWAEKAKGKDFLFCPKMYKGVTHFGSLGNKGFISDEFLKGVIAFKEHLGPIFIQVSESFSPNRKVELFNYLQSLPRDVQFFLEVRHADWLVKEDILQTLLECLKQLNIGLVITDTAGFRHCAHMHITIPKTFIRYVGNSLHESDYTRIDAWVQRMHHWINQGMEELYFFMHMHDEAKSPELTVYLIEQLHAIGELQLIKPQFVAQPGSLF